jgi:sigma-B regulation protein RsbU (phosphoserine phosphatase)
MPALEVAGDYYDLIPAPDGKVYLVIGDVTDKGMPASLFMVFTRSAIRASLETEGPLSATLGRANRLLCLESGEGLFVTLFIACLDPATGEMKYVNAGHNPPFHKDGADSRFNLLKQTGIPLGIDPDFVYEERSVRVEPGDLLVLYTDGIPEAVDSRGSQFGMERLESAVLRGAGRPASDLIEMVMEAVSEHADPGKANDDITLLVVQRCPN